jgi:hypothetical protein
MSFLHDHYKKRAINAIKKDIRNFNEDFLTEIAYNEKDFNNRIYIFNYSVDVTYLYVVTVHQEYVEVEHYYNEYGYSVINGKVE